MWRTLGLVMGLNLVLAGHVCADLPGGHHPRPYPWEDLEVSAPPKVKYSDVRIRLEGIGKYPDQVFCVRYTASVSDASGGNKVSHEVVEVKNSDAVTLNTDGNLQVLTMKRDEFKGLAKADPTLRWMNAETKGVMVADAQLPRDEPLLVITCKVTVKSGFLFLTKSKLTVQVVSDNRHGRLPLPPIWALGIVTSLLMTGLGLWFTRRRTWNTLSGA
jgi:hypothetical protein